MDEGISQASSGPRTTFGMNSASAIPIPRPSVAETVPSSSASPSTMAQIWRTEAPRHRRVARERRRVSARTWKVFQMTTQVNATANSPSASVVVSMMLAESRRRLARSWAIDERDWTTTPGSVETSESIWASEAPAAAVTYTLSTASLGFLPSRTSHCLDVASATYPVRLVPVARVEPELS